MTNYPRTPWTFRASLKHDGGIRLGNENESAAFVPGYIDHPGNIATAAFIVKAVNSHDVLIEAIQDIILNSREKFAVERAIRAMRETSTTGESDNG